MPEWIRTTWLPSTILRTCNASSEIKPSLEPGTVNRVSIAQDSAHRGRETGSARDTRPLPPLPFSGLNDVRPAGSGPSDDARAVASHPWLPLAATVCDGVGQNDSSATRIRFNTAPTRNASGDHVDPEADCGREMPKSLKAWAAACGSDGNPIDWLRLDCKPCLDTLKSTLRDKSCSKKDIRTCLTSGYLVNDLKLQCRGQKLDARARFDLVEQYIAVLASAFSKGCVSRDDVFGVLFGKQGMAYRVDTVKVGDRGAGVKGRFMNVMRAMGLSNATPVSNIAALGSDSIASILLSDHENWILTTREEIYDAGPMARGFANAVRAALDEADDSWQSKHHFALETDAGYGADKTKTIIERLKEPLDSGTAQVSVREMLLHTLNAIGFTSNTISRTELTSQALDDVIVHFQGIFQVREARVETVRARVAAQQRFDAENRAHGAPKQKTIGARISAVFNRIGQFFKRMFSNAR